MKVPNFDGKNQITTDVEIVTSELLNHRLVGRFLERYQYLRRKTVEPIDAPTKTVVRGKIIKVKSIYYALLNLSDADYFDPASSLFKMLISLH